jgi:hypothetical protein
MLVAVPFAAGAQFGGMPGLARDVQLTKTVRSGHEIVINEHMAWNYDCGMREIARVYLEKAPSLGVACVRVADVEIRQVAFGSAPGSARCIGRIVRGVQIVYLAQSGSIGVDDLRYTVQYTMNRRSIGVVIDVQADQPPTRSALPKDITEPRPNYVQPLGRIPPCTALVS